MGRCACIGRLWSRLPPLHSRQADSDRLLSRGCDAHIAIAQRSFVAVSHDGGQGQEPQGRGRYPRVYHPPPQALAWLVGTFSFSLFFSLLLFLRFVFVCRPLSMSNSLGAKSSGLYFSRVCSASFDVFVRLWFLFLLYSPIPPPSGVLVILCFHDLMYQHQEISFWNVYPPFCGLLHRFWIFICFKVRIFVFLCLVDLSKVVRMLPCVLCASWNGAEVRWQNMEGKKIFHFLAVILCLLCRNVSGTEVHSAVQIEIPCIRFPFLFFSLFGCCFVFLDISGNRLTFNHQGSSLSSQSMRRRGSSWDSNSQRPALQPNPKPLG